MIIQKIKVLARRKRYQLFKAYKKLNIWGFRSNATTPNQFDDELHVFFNTKQSGRPKWAYFIFKCTTDPGTYWLDNPMNPKGTAMLSPGQYVDTYKIDLHRGKYYALCQRLGKVEVIRDYNRDAILDFYNGKPDSGKFGINIHRARRSGSTLKVDNHSAGCQVFKNADDFNFFMRLCEMHRELHGNKFTYTLIDQRIERRTTFRRLAIAGGLIGAITAGYYLINN